MRVHLHFNLLIVASDAIKVKSSKELSAAHLYTYPYGADENLTLLL